MDITTLLGTLANNGIVATLLVISLLFNYRLFNLLIAEKDRNRDKMEAILDSSDKKNEAMTNAFNVLSSKIDGKNGTN